MFFSEVEVGFIDVLLTTFLLFLLLEVAVNSLKAYCLLTGHTLIFYGAEIASEC